MQNWACPQVGQPASPITTDTNQRAAVPEYTAKTTEPPFIRGFPLLIGCRQTNTAAAGRPDRQSYKHNRRIYGNPQEHGLPAYPFDLFHAGLEPDGAPRVIIMKSATRKKSLTLHAQAGHLGLHRHHG